MGTVRGAASMRWHRRISHLQHNRFPPTVGQSASVAQKGHMLHPEEPLVASIWCDPTSFKQVGIPICCLLYHRTLSAGWVMLTDRGLWLGPAVHAQEGD